MSDANRRSFLKVGAAFPIALESLAASSLGFGAAEKPQAPPQRIMFICNSLGFYAPYFYPKKRGDLQSSTYLRDIKLADKVTVFENLFHPGMATSNHDSEKSFLTGAPNPEASNFTNQISLDQVLARKMGNKTRFPFLNFSLYDRGWGCSWNERGSAIPPMHNEEDIFAKLFGNEELGEKKQKFESDQQVLSCLHRDLELLQAKGGDAAKISSYQAVARDLEEKIAHEKYWLTTKKPKVSHSLSSDTEFGFSTKVQNMFELAKLAFRTDSTRIISFSLDWIYGAITVPGASGGWHTLSHHGGRAAILAKLSRVEIDILKHFKKFLQELEQIKEGNGSLLDHTTVVLGSNFGDASNHTCHALPTVVAGGGHRHQAHCVLPGPTPLCNLYLELLHKHDIDVKSFGSSEKDMGLLGQ